MSPLATKLLRLVFALYFGIALLTTATQLYVEYGDERDSLFDEIGESVALIMPALTSAAWDLDEDVVKSSLHALFQNQAVSGLRMEGDIEYVEGRVVDSSVASAYQSTLLASVYTQSFPIEYTDDDGSETVLGYLYVYTDASVVVSRVESIFYAVIASALIKTVCLWLILYFSLKYLVSMPLANLSRHVDEISRNLGAAQDSGNRRNKDELSLLFRAFIKMRRALKKSTAELLEKQNQLVVAAKQAQAANDSKSEFLANMSHELRTPMHAILSFSEIGQRKLSEKEAAEVKYFNNINAAGERLLSLLDNLLELSTLDAGDAEIEYSERSVRELVDEAVNKVAIEVADKSITVCRELPAGDIDCSIDFARCVDVFRHLLANAIAFSPKGSTVVISADNDVSDNWIQFAVEDEGVGIPDNEVDAIFDKFTQSSTTKSKAGGTGLGLSICREIVEQHGGKIWAETGRRTGARLVVQLPVSADTLKAA